MGEGQKDTEYNKEQNQLTHTTAISYGDMESPTITTPHTCVHHQHHDDSSDDDDDDDDELYDQHVTPSSDVLTRVVDILLQRGERRSALVNAPSTSIMNVQSHSLSGGLAAQDMMSPHANHEHYDDTDKNLDLSFKPPPPTFSDRLHDRIDAIRARLPKKIPKTLRQAVLLFVGVFVVFGGLFYLMETLNVTKSMDLTTVSLPFGEVRGISLKLTDEVSLPLFCIASLFPYGLL